MKRSRASSNEIFHLAFFFPLKRHKKKEKDRNVLKENSLVFNIL